MGSTSVPACDPIEILVRIQAETPVLVTFQTHSHLLVILFFAHSSHSLNTINVHNARA